MASTTVLGSPLKGHPNRDPDAATEYHIARLGSVVYLNALNLIEKLIVGEDYDASAEVFINESLRRLAPRDPIEEMLAIQIIVTHARILHLTRLATKASLHADIRMLNECLDRALNTSRRLSASLKDYRKPPRGGDAFVAIRNANIAQQQVIGFDERGIPNATNEQGCSARPSASAPLPPEPRGIESPSEERRASASVGAVNRPQDA